jgi:hypothetical protein
VRMERDSSDGVGVLGVVQVESCRSDFFPSHVATLAAEVSRSVFASGAALVKLVLLMSRAIPSATTTEY